MIDRLLSGDRPNSRPLALVLIAIALALAFAPFLFPGTKSLDTAARICIFIVLVASYDLLLGYTGIVSFAHTMFFGIGAYGVALSLSALGASFTAIVVGVLGGTAVAAALALAIGLFSLRVKAIFFAMVTLAVASAFAVLVSQLSTITGGPARYALKPSRPVKSVPTASARNPVRRSVAGPGSDRTTVKLRFAWRTAKSRKWLSR